jgi:hypothetical protein
LPQRYHHCIWWCIQLHYGTITVAMIGYW